MRAGTFTQSKHAMAKLLLTATQEVSQRLVRKLEAIGHVPVLMPLLKVNSLPYVPPPYPPTAILITSRHALNAAKNYLGTPLYIVGAHTAELAHAQGHTVAAIAPKLEALKSKLPTELLYLRGANISQELDIPARICYTAELLPPPPELPEHDAIIVLSARVAEHLPATTRPIFCFSERIRQALPAPLQPQAQLCEEPTETALMEKIKHWSASQ